jgi:small subunit ribosomal protein S17
MANVKAKPEKETKPAKPAAKPAVAAAPKAEVPADTRNPLQKRRTITGTVVSDKMKKTIVVEVDRQVRHGLYEKYLVRSTRYKAHDEKNEAKIGDRVSLVESRPMSRDKRWVLQTIIRKAGQVVEANV